MNKDLEELLEECRVIINRDFAPCGLKEDVEKRIHELYEEWKEAKAKADREGKTIGGLKVIFSDLLRAVRFAKEQARKSGKTECYYLRKWLEIPPTSKGGLGYYSKSMWGYEKIEE